MSGSCRLIWPDSGDGALEPGFDRGQIYRHKPVLIKRLKSLVKSWPPARQMRVSGPCAPTKTAIISV